MTGAQPLPTLLLIARLRSTARVRAHVVKAFEEPVFCPCTLGRTWGTRPTPTTVVWSLTPARTYFQTSLRDSICVTVVRTQTLKAVFLEDVRLLRIQDAMHLKRRRAHIRLTEHHVHLAP